MYLYISIYMYTYIHLNIVILYLHYFYISEIWPYRFWQPVQDCIQHVSCLPSEWMRVRDGRYMSIYIYM